MAKVIHLEILTLSSTARGNGWPSTLEDLARGPLSCPPCPPILPITKTCVPKCGFSFWIGAWNWFHLGFTVTHCLSCSPTHSSKTSCNPFYTHCLTEAALGKDISDVETITSRDPFSVLRRLSFSVASDTGDHLSPWNIVTANKWWNWTWNQAGWLWNLCFWLLHLYIYLYIYISISLLPLPQIA